VRASNRTIPPRPAASGAGFADLVGELEAALRLRLRESPRLTFAVAGGIGYVLGGGLTPAVLTRTLRLALRVVVANRAEQALADWVTMGGGGDDARGA
jgi:hypothetical protein